MSGDTYTEITSVLSLVRTLEESAFGPMGASITYKWSGKKEVHLTHHGLGNWSLAWAADNGKSEALNNLGTEFLRTVFADPDFQKEFGLEKDSSIMPMPYKEPSELLKSFAQTIEDFEKMPCNGQAMAKILSTGHNVVSVPTPPETVDEQHMARLRKEAQHQKYSEWDETVKKLGGIPNHVVKTTPPSDKEWAAAFGPPALKKLITDLKSDGWREPDAMAHEQTMAVWEGPGDSIVNLGEGAALIFADLNSRSIRIENPTPEKLRPYRWIGAPKVVEPAPEPKKPFPTQALEGRDKTWTPTL